MVKNQDNLAVPFIKWAGGKRWAANEICTIIRPYLKNRYFEPFLGGGAVFFKLNPPKSTLSDINADLINAYEQVRDNPDILISRLRKKRVTANNYYRIRAQEPAEPVDRAIRFLFLNRTAFGGLYRLNRKGEFNVPYGGGERNPSPLWKNNVLHSCSKQLKKTKFQVSDFAKTMQSAGKGDVVYCDPAYTVAHGKNGFIKYNEKVFSWSDQERLHSAALAAIGRGALVIVSNAAHQSILDLYTPSKPIILNRFSGFATNSHHRKTVEEYLFVMHPEQFDHNN